MRQFIMTAALIAAAAGPAAAQGRWKPIGKTAANNLVSVDPKSVKTAKGIITAKVQVTFTEPVVTPKGPWKVSQHLAMFDCAKKTVAAKTSTYFSNAAATKVVETKTISMPGFGPAIGGSMTQVALDYFCKGK